MSGFDVTDEAVAAVCAYMNQYQPDSNDYIVQYLGGVGEFQNAQMAGFTKDAVIYSVDVAGVREIISVPWPQEVLTRADAKNALFDLVDLAYDREQEIGTNSNQ